MLSRLRKNPLRTALTLLQVLLGALAMTLALSAYLGATEKQAEAQPERFDLVSGYQDEDGSSSAFYMMDEAHSAQLLALTPAVDKAALYMEAWNPNVVRNGRLYQFDKGAFVGLDYFAVNNISPVQGSLFSSQDARTEAAVVVIAEGAAKILFGDASPLSQILTFTPSEGFTTFDEESNELPLEPEAFTVVGTFAEKTGDRPDAWNQTYIYLPLWKSGEPGNSTGTLSVLAKPGQGDTAREQMISAARQVYAQQLIDWDIETSKDFYVREMGDYGFPQDQSNLLDPTVIMFSLFGIVALIVGSIGIFSIQLVDALERERDTGIRRALGATRGRIVREMTTEAALLSGLGGLLGALIAALVIPVLTRGVGNSLFWSIDLRWQPLAALLVVGLTLVLGLVLGIFPALRSSRTDVVQALRG